MEGWNGEAEDQVPAVIFPLSFFFWWHEICFLHLGFGRSLLEEKSCTWINTYLL